MKNLESDEILEYCKFVTNAIVGGERELTKFNILPEYLEAHVKSFAHLIENKSLVFLGDGDGMGVLVALLASNDLLPLPKEIVVLDIDERKLNLYKTMAEKQNPHNKIKFETRLYNVFDKVPAALVSRFNFFHINPPFKANKKPKGLGFAFFLERALELTKTEACGVVVYPMSDPDMKWATAVKTTLDKTLTKYKLAHQKLDVTHKYALAQVVSSNLLVLKNGDVKNKYKGKVIPHSTAKRLYYKDIVSTQYINDDGSKDGKYTIN